MWVFLATEVMFFGTLLHRRGSRIAIISRSRRAASIQLNWLIGGINTVVLLVSSLMMVLAVHSAQARRAAGGVPLPLADGRPGDAFLCFKGLEYYLDYRENLIPGWQVRRHEWIAPAAARIDRRTGRLRENIPVSLLDDDRFPRDARDDRHRRGVDDGRPDVAGPFLRGVLLADRRHGAVLALRRPRLDLFLPHVVSCWARTQL